MNIIFDSTPLIYLCKVGLDWIFEELGTECIIPDSVYDDVVKKGMHGGCRCTYCGWIGQRGFYSSPTCC